MLSLEDMVDEKAMVRVIDRFVVVTDLEKLDFEKTKPASTGRPPYAPKALTKLYVYGYENGIRSSRKLEKETARTVEVMWLVEGVTPDYKATTFYRAGRHILYPVKWTRRGILKIKDLQISKK